MWLVVGLGNPGAKYSKTRHNIGFMAVDTLVQKYSGSTRDIFNSEASQIKINSTDILMIKPQTFMNLSGTAVSQAFNYYKLDLNNMIVIHDEIDQSFGKIKIQKSRGHGGHNGVRDIHQKLGSMDYTRIRMGIGRPIQSHAAVADFVLSPFSDEENKELKSFLEQAVSATEIIIKQGWESAARLFNNS